MKRSLSHHKFLSFVFISLLAILLTTFFSSFVAFADDEFTENEPNNSFDQANVIEVGKEVTGEFGDESDDYFKLSITKECEYYLYFGSGSESSGVALYDNKMIKVDPVSVELKTNVVTIGLVPERITYNLKQGDYYVRCSNNGKEGFGDYDFRIEEKTNFNTTTDVYRLYNKYTGEHFYTTSKDEKENLLKVGWNDEGTGWHVPGKSNTPVYRLYNKYAGDHHYTTNEKESENLKNAGWTYEGISFYSDDSKGCPIYRQYNPYTKTGMHNFTLSSAEAKNLVKLGWEEEGVAWYGDPYYVTK